MRARRTRGAAERGKPPARRLKRAQILLAADAGVGDEDIAANIGVGGSTVYRTRRRFVESSLDLALSEDPRPGAERKLAGKQEALLAAAACSSPPAGRARWTLELLADALVKVTTHESLSRETAPRRLAENKLKPWRKDMGCIPPSTRIASPAWRTCSISTPKRPTRSGPWFASTRARFNSSARPACRSRPSRDRSSATTASTGATARRTCSSSST